MGRIARRPGTVVLAAIVALAVVTAGTATAARLITGKQIKNGSIGMKDLSKKTKKKLRKPGPAGPQGQAGAPGVRGEQGPQGEPGPFPGVLPRGKTLTGVWAIAGATSGEQAIDGDISFGFQFASAPDPVVVSLNDTPQQATAAGCPGTVTEPRADPGKLCIYEAGRGGTKSTVLTTDASGDPAHLYVFVPPGFSAADADKATRFGAGLEILSDGAGNPWANGTWAATSP